MGTFWVPISMGLRSSGSKRAVRSRGWKIHLIYLQVSVQHHAQFCFGREVTFCAFFSCGPTDAAAVYSPDEPSHADVSGNRMRGAVSLGTDVSTAANSPLIPVHPGGTAAAVLYEACRRLESVELFIPASIRMHSHPCTYKTHGLYTP